MTRHNLEDRTLIAFILTMLIVGVIAGFLARAIVPGDDSMSIAATIVLGIVGSFIGGFLGWAVMGKDLQEGALQPSGILGSVIGAVLALLAYRFATRRGGAHI